jgi:hypothetical protein
MKILTPILLLATLLAATGSSIAQDGKSFPGIESLMTAEEYKAAGMDKLTPAERDALNSFLIRYTAEDSEVMRNTDEDVIKAVEEQEILSSIKPPFKGWSGNTVFRLENGQTWQQRRRGNYKHMGTDTRVRITKNFMGFHRMEMVDSGKSVQVKRVQ